MTYMIGYLAGDHQTFAVRKADTTDMRLAVDFPEDEHMLVICIMQDGEILMSWSENHDEAKVEEMYLVGRITTIGHPTGSLHLVMEPTVNQMVRPPDSLLRLVPPT